MLEFRVSLMSRQSLSYGFGLKFEGWSWVNGFTAVIRLYAQGLG